MRKRIVSLFIVIIVALHSILSYPQITRGTDQLFSDVPRDHWAYDTIQWAVEQKIVNGYPDGTFKPGHPVKEAEFLAMLFRAYPTINIPKQAKGEAWYDPYFSLADSYHWPVWYETDGTQYDRGRVAQVVAASQGKRLDRTASVQFLLDKQLSNGKTSATVEGYKMNDRLTRAEAAKFIQNMKSMGVALSKASNSDAQLERTQVRGISIGDSEATVIAKLGQPARKDLSEYGFYWYIYNEDYNKYVQVGIKDRKVVGLYTNSNEWSTKAGINRGASVTAVKKAYGEGLEYILKGNTKYYYDDDRLIEAPTYLVDSEYITFFIDLHAQHTVSAVQIIEQSTELAMHGFHGEPTEELQQSFERQMFDVLNAARVQFGKEALEWDDRIASTARKHSKDMADRDFFAHNNPDGKSPFDRMDDDGIKYSVAAENLAAGSTSAIFAHEGLMNSEGHRNNILSDDVTHVGVGVSLGSGTFHAYYTQNYYTPMGN